MSWLIRFSTRRSINCHRKIRFSILPGSLEDPMTVKQLDPGYLNGWLEGLLLNQTLIAPVEHNGHFAFEPVSQVSDIRLDYDVTTLPPKKFLSAAQGSAGDLPQRRPLPERLPGRPLHPLRGAPLRREGHLPDGPGLQREPEGRALPGPPGPVLHRGAGPADDLPQQFFRLHERREPRRMAGTSSFPRWGTSSWPRLPPTRERP